VYASLKTSRKNPVEKKVGEKSTSHASLMLQLLPVKKPCMRKPSGKNSSREKKSTIVNVHVSLQDQLVIFRTTVMDCVFGAGLPLNPAVL